MKNKLTVHDSGSQSNCQIPTPSPTKTTLIASTRSRLPWINSPKKIRASTVR